VIITNKFNLPDPVFRALSADDYDRGKSNRSVTQLIDSPRARILRAEHDHEIEVDVSEMLWIAQGKAMHRMFEEYAAGKYTPEERLFTKIDGWSISGAIDIRYNANHTHSELMDYKVTSVWSIIFGKEEWHRQLNFYAWLVERVKRVKVNKLSVLAICRDWKESERQRQGGDYPECPILIVDIPLWSPEERQAYVEERVRIHQEAEFLRLTGDTLPFCSPEERWQRNTTYAVMKGSNKRAMKVCQSAEEAQAYIDEHKDKAKLSVTERRGEPVRCARGYCKAALWCDQYQGELNEEGD